MTFYATPATGAGWIVPKKYVEKVGEDGFKKAPVGAGPYRFVSFTPGVELVLEAGDLWCDISVTGTAEAALNYLQAVGIRAKLRPLERAGFLSAFREKKLRNLVFTISGIHGNAATRIEAFAASTGVYGYGAYPDIDGLFREQAGELDPKKREAILHRIQTCG